MISLSSSRQLTIPTSRIAKVSIRPNPPSVNAAPDTHEPKSALWQEHERRLDAEIDE